MSLYNFSVDLLTSTKLSPLSTRPVSPFLFPNSSWHFLFAKKRKTSFNWDWRRMQLTLYTISKDEDRESQRDSVTLLTPPHILLLRSTKKMIKWNITSHELQMSWTPKRSKGEQKRSRQQQRGLKSNTMIRIHEPLHVQRIQRYNDSPPLELTRGLNYYLLFNH